MAVFKPTDCSPLNGTFDFSERPIWFECKVDTSNTKITGYSVEVYNSEGTKIFPTNVNVPTETYSDSDLTKTATTVSFVVPSEPTTILSYAPMLVSYFSRSYDAQSHTVTLTFQAVGVAPSVIQVICKWEQRENFISLVSDLKLYTSANYPSLISATDNTGVNGTMLKIPFFKSNSEQSPTGSDWHDTVVRNQYNPSAGNINNGSEYSWRVALYQEVSWDTNTNNVKLPTSEIYYDMPLTTGQVMGSNNERIQTAPVSSDAVLIDKQLQLCKITFNNSTTEDDVKTWSGTISTNNAPSRNLITNYIDTTGYIYPSMASGNAFPASLVTRSSGNNGFQIYKNGNNIANLSATDIVSYVYNVAIAEGSAQTTTGLGTWTWNSHSTSESLSHWTQVRNVPDRDNMEPLPGLGTMSVGQRVILNHMAKSEVVSSDIYKGSPYNGIYYLKSSSSEASGATYNITYEWYRTTDADTWGELSNKVVYVEHGSYDGSGATSIIPIGSNVEINMSSNAGVLNSTPFMFEAEKPIKLYNYTDSVFETKSPETPAVATNLYRISVENPISQIISIETGGAAISSTLYSFGINTRDIYLQTTGLPASSYNITYIPYNLRDYTGLVFYNKPKGTDNQGKLYIRPFSGLDSNMIFREINGTSNPRWFIFDEINTDYWYVKYSTVHQGPGVAQSDILDIGSRYQIKSFYQTSDYNPFSLYQKPSILVSYKYLDGTNVGATITRRDFTAYVVSYSQSNYIQWQSYQYLLYLGNTVDSGELIYSGEEKYDGNIEQTFYGLLDGDHYYTLRCIIYTNSGAEIVSDAPIHAVINPLTSANLTSTSSTIDASRLASKLTYAYSGSSSASLAIYRREIWYDRFHSNGTPRYENKWHLVYRTNSPTSSISTIYDYNIANHRNYEYAFIVTTSSGEEAVYTTTKTNWTGWTLTELYPDKETGAYLTDAKNSWRFKYNISAGDFAQNISKSQQETLSKFPKFSHGLRNSISGSVSCLLGREVLPAMYTDVHYKYIPSMGWQQDVDANDIENLGGYKEGLSRWDYVNGTLTYTAPEILGFNNLSSNESIDMLKAWQEICYSGNPKLLRDEKGQSFIVQIYDTSSSIQESYNDMPINIAFSWAEIINAVPQIVVEIPDSITSVYSVTHSTDSKVTFTGNAQATSGVDYVCTIAINDSLYDLNGPTVSVGGVILSQDKYTYTNNELTIFGIYITGNVEISYNSVRTRIQINSSLTNCSITSGSTGIKPINIAYTIEITANSTLYFKTSDCIVKDSEQTIVSSGVTCTLSENERKLTVSILPSTLASYSQLNIICTPSISTLATPTNIRISDDFTRIVWDPVDHADWYQILLIDSRQHGFNVYTNSFVISEHITPGSGVSVQVQAAADISQSYRLSPYSDPRTLFGVNATLFGYSAPSMSYCVFSDATYDLTYNLDTTHDYIVAATGTYGAITDVSGASVTYSKLNNSQAQVEISNASQLVSFQLHAQMIMPTNISGTNGTISFTGALGADSYGVYDTEGTTIGELEVSDDE